MAYRLNFSSPLNGMTHIWNVSDTVGDLTTCKNNPTDVDLVALLLGSFIRSLNIGRAIHQSCHQPFLVNGSMDINIAYWIRAMNVQHTKKLDWGESGIISRAKKSTFNSGDTWSIVKLNIGMYLHMRPHWETFPNHPQCPPALKKELLTKTSP